MNNFRLVALLGIMMCLLLVPAHANIVVMFDSAVACGTDCFTWTYSALLSGVAESSDPLNGGPFSTFFTLYDIQGLLGSITQPANWSSSTQNAGTTPPGV